MNKNMIADAVEGEEGGKPLLQPVQSPEPPLVAMIEPAHQRRRRGKSHCLDTVDAIVTAQRPGHASDRVKICLNMDIVADMRRNTVPIQSGKCPARPPGADKVERFHHADGIHKDEDEVTAGIQQPQHRIGEPRYVAQAVEAVEIGQNQVEGTEFIGAIYRAEPVDIELAKCNGPPLGMEYRLPACNIEHPFGNVCCDDFPGMACQPEGILARAAIQFQNAVARLYNL
jgi:hypothetical protein